MLARDTVVALVLTAAPGPTPSPTSGAGGATDGTAIGALALIAVTVLVIGAVLGVFFSFQNGNGKTTQADRGFVRSWLAMSLVVGLLLFTAVVLLTPGTEEQLRTVLVTALTTSVAAAVSFYFATKANERVIAALVGEDSEPVPDLVGLETGDALRLLGKTGFRLMVDRPAGLIATSTTITEQDPRADTRVALGSTITVTLSPAAAGT